MRSKKGSPVGEIRLKTQVDAKSPNQSAYLESMQKNVYTFGVGLAGTGKTFLATWEALLELLDTTSKIQRIVVIRPVIGNKFGESIGALPGNIAEKMLPYGSSIIDNLNAFLERDAINKMLTDGTIEFIPLSLLRGRSLNNAFVIVEEAQNIKLAGKGVYMVMSRLGAHSKMVFNGDLGQSDLGEDQSALADAIDRLKDMKGVGIVKLYDRVDIQRHPLLYEIMQRFDETDDNPF